MIALSDEVKTLLTDGQSHDYAMTLEFGNELYFTEPEIILTEVDIKAESASLSDSICTSETLQFGIINAAKFSCTLLGVGDNLKGKYMKVTYYIEGNAVPYGRYYVESCDRTAYSSERELVAYDYAYLLNQDARKFFFMKMKSFSCAEVSYELFEYLGFQYEEYEFPNNLNLNKMGYITLTYSTILQWVGEINWGWWKPNKYGVFQFYQIDMTSIPEQIDTILPQTADYEDYITEAYDSITFPGYLRVSTTMPQEEEYTYTPDKSEGINPYSLSQDNAFVNYKTVDELDELGQILLPHYAEVIYRPNSVQFDGRPYLECGDLYQFVNDDEDAELQLVKGIILSQTIKGIGALVTTLETRGTRTTSDPSAAQVTSNKSINKTLSTASANAQAIADANYYISRVKYISETQYAITVKSLSDSSVEVTNVWNRSVDSAGNEVLENTVNGQVITFEGWPEEA